MKDKEQYSLGMSDEKINILAIPILLGVILGFIFLDGALIKVALSLAALLGVILLFTFQGIEINYKTKIARQYSNYFILKVYSEKIDLKPTTKVILELYHELGRVKSMSTSGSSPSLTKSYDIYLISPKGKLLISQIEYYRDAQKFLIIVSKKLNIPFKDTFLTHRQISEKKRRS